MIHLDRKIKTMNVVERLGRLGIIPVVKIDEAKHVRHN